jgi:hypothetical protein
MPCAGGLFNFKAGSIHYSLLKDDYPRLPLFSEARDNRLLNEFAFYCLKRLHELQNFAALKLTCNDVEAHFAQMYSPIAATGNLQQVPETYFYSKELVAYLTAMLSTVPYFKTGDSRITGVMDEQYTAALHRLRGMNDKAFNDYIVRRMTAYIARWPVEAKAAALAAPEAPAEGGGGGGDAADVEEGFVLTASDDDEEEEPAPPAFRGDGGTGA